MELEYGAKAWWTTELYLSGQHTSNDSTIFTGFRWENRFRPFWHDHFINPVLYVEYENLSKADRSLLEITGHDSISDLRLSNAQGKTETERSLELKLILSSNVKGWNISENFITEKDLNESRALGVRICRRRQPSAGLCREPAAHVRLLPRELSCRRRAVWRPRRSRRLWSESHLALCSADGDFQYSSRADR